MEANKVRAISKEGKPVMLSKTVAENTAFMKKYGYRIEQVKKEKPVDTPAAKTEAVTGEATETTTDNAGAQEPEKPAETQKPSDKPTRKTGPRKKRNQSK